jgi:hypothetical protein
MKRKLIALLILSVSIGAKGQNKSQQTNETSKIAVTLTFINDYVKYCDNRDSESKTTKWIESNKLLTPEFKKSYKELIEDARKREPEMGLGFDPIFDAQDYPDKGFEFLKFDNDEYLMVRGKDWSTFTTVIKVRLVRNKWMVDGAGVVNIPKNKQRAK